MAPRKRVAGVLLFLLTACGESAAAPEPPREQATPPPPFTPPTPEEAWGLELPSLRDVVGRLEERAAEGAGTPAGVEDARRVVELGRVLDLREPDPEWIPRARERLTVASADRVVAGACGAALDLARLEARDAADPRAAYIVALRTSLRFAASDAECASIAGEMLPALGPWRPDDRVLSAIRADPDVDRPVPGVAGPDAIAQWAAEQVEEGGERSTLESLLVYGHRANAEGEAASVRVVVRFDRPVAYEHGEAPSTEGTPRRTWLHLAGASAGEGVVSELPVDEGGLTRVRVSAVDGGTRVTLDLEDEARFRAYVLPSPFRIVLDVEVGGAHAEGPVERIVLDPGHGGDDFGARAFGMRESDLVLDIARRVRVLLVRRLPHVEVLLTRETDDFVSLEQRSAMANAVDADLFLSIHLNAADEEVERGGVTTFVLDTSDDRQAARLAARENGTAIGELDSLSRLLASLHREDQVRASRAFAEQVHRETLIAGREHLRHLHDRGVRSALFYVLVGARMPAVLLEASFLSREDEAEALRRTEYRQALAEGIANGIVRWAR